jgi:hypothetical protein
MVPYLYMVMVFGGALLFLCRAGVCSVKIFNGTKISKGFGVAHLNLDYLSFLKSYIGSSEFSPHSLRIQNAYGDRYSFFDGFLAELYFLFWVM